MTAFLFFLYLDSLELTKPESVSRLKAHFFHNEVLLTTM
jgi:hypothetical protein